MDNLKDDRYYVSKLLQNIDFLIVHTKDVPEEQFVKDEVLLDSVSFRLIQISECAAKINDSFKAEHPEVGWYEIKGLRNRLVHDYGNIDLHIVFETVRNDIPKLKESLGKIL